MALTLYRKYRPQRFDELIGQNHIKITLKHEIERGEVCHAYLFSGPRGLGKTTTARLMAKAVNCENRADEESEPCDQCRSCREIVAGRNIDILEIDAASHTGVDKVRENIIETVRITPHSSKFKVFIIDEVHMLSGAAFNALLKTLEEPPKYVIFILCTTEVHKLPETIISRCQRFDFKKASSKDLIKRLREIVAREKKEVAEKVLENIVVHSEGCIRDAESLLGKVLTLGEKITEEQAEAVLPRSEFKNVVVFLNFLLDRNAAAAIELINRLVEEGVDLEAFNEDLLEFLRKVILLKVSGRLADFGVELEEESRRAAEKLTERFNWKELLSAVRLFGRKVQELKSASIAQFPLETAVIEFTQADSENNGRSGSGGGSQGNSEDKPKTKPADQSNSQKNKPAVELANVKVPKSDREKLKMDFLSASQKNFSGGKAVSFKEIKEPWKEIVAKVAKKNYSLGETLKLSVPIDCQENIVKIAVRHNFYKERLEDSRNLRLIAETISETVRGEVSIKAVVNSELKSQLEERADLTGREPKENLKPESNSQKPQDVVQEVINMF